MLVIIYLNFVVMLYCFKINKKPSNYAAAAAANLHLNPANSNFCFYEFFIQ
jgi:hypothetical protein